MELKNIPVEIISKFNTTGEITPLRLRLENEEHCLVTAHITNILYIKNNNYSGINTIDYGCNLKVEDKEHLVQLRYFVSSHKWTLHKVFY